jgi:hypothetical protein
VGVLEGASSEVSSGMERLAPVPRAEVEMLRDCRAETVHASISTEEVVGCAGCWDGGGTEE